MLFSGPLVVVRDINKSRRFYEDVLGLELLMDLDGNMVFTCHISLQDEKIWADFLHIQENEICHGGNAFELYFEEDDIEGFLKHLAKFSEIKLANEPTVYPWGQKAVRFYDLDGHLIEVGQSMRSLAWQFQDQGMSLEEIAEKIMHPMEYVLQCIKERP